MSLPEKLRKFDYPIPKHAMRPGYMFGGVAAFLLVPLVVSGLVMSYYGYVPSWDLAHKTSAEAAALGGLSGMRSVHSLSAELFLILIFLHATRIVITRSYHGERKVIWYTGVVLFFFAALFHLTGSTLKMDQAGYETYTHMAIFMPLKQVWFRGAHTILLPILTIAVLGSHALLIKEKQISALAPNRRTDDGPQATFLQHMVHVVAYGFLAVAVVYLGAAFYTPSIVGAPVEGVEWTKPPWPFLFLYPLNSWALIAIPLATFTGLLILPFLTNPSKKWDFSQAIYFAVIAVWAGLSLYGALKHFV